MASIRYRKAKGCVNYSYQVQFRRKGIPSLTISFVTHEEALDFVNKNEENYLKNPEKYENLRNSYRQLRREREFKIKKMKDYVPRRKPKCFKNEDKFLMAYMDKIYGNKQQWKELKNFLHQNGKTKWVNEFMYPEPEEEGPISNFSKEADMWLLENCPLRFVIDRIKDQYNIK